MFRLRHVFGEPFSDELDLLNFKQDEMMISEFNAQFRQLASCVDWSREGEVTGRLRCTYQSIINWILKRYPGRIPPTCANCLETRAVQDHIATCNRLYDGLDTSITPRFRPEMILSTEPPSLQFQALRNIAKNIATAVQNSIPDYDFEILHF
jgi:hypothetical protein